VGNADPLYDEKICIGALWLSLYEAESMKKLTSAIMKLLWSTERNYKYGYGMSNFISGGWETVRSNRAIQHPINSRDLKSLVSSRISKLHVKNIAINPISHSRFYVILHAAVSLVRTGSDQSASNLAILWRGAWIE